MYGYQYKNLLLLRIHSDTTQLPAMIGFQMSMRNSLKKVKWSCNLRMGWYRGFEWI